MDEIGQFKQPCPTEDELVSYAKGPTLQRFEVLALKQGFLPNQHTESYLECNAQQAQRLIRAFAEGELIDPVRPEVLVRWCVDNDVELPEPFMARILKGIFPARRPSPPATYTDERIWQKTCRGRPKKKPSAVVHGLEPEIGNRARTLMILYIKEHGKRPGKKTLTAGLARETGRKPSDIDRTYRFKTCITRSDFEKAKRYWHSNRNKN